jgi:hypothetical protein
MKNGKILRKTRSNQSRSSKKICLMVYGIPSNEGMP